MSFLSKKARYAIHGLAYVATRADDGKPVTFDEILAYLRTYARGLALSPGYIAKVFQEISRAGLTEAVCGPLGGYRLARPPESVRLVEIIECIDGPMLSDCCLLSIDGCGKQPGCEVRGVIREGEMAMYDVFHRETLATLAGRMQFPEASVIEAHRSAAAAGR